MQRDAGAYARDSTDQQSAHRGALQLKGGRNCATEEQKRSRMMFKDHENSPWRARIHKVIRVLSWAAGVWAACVLLLRFINPPITPLIAIRAMEYQWRGQNVITQWEWVPLDQIPLTVQQAVVAAEDARYMEHWGIDLAAMGDAIEDSSGRKRPRGASTITMQTVKNVFLWPGRSYLRKGLEALMAPVVGVLWGKRRTLEIYLNVIEWGEGVYGIQAASRRYFGRPVSQLTLAQGAALAAVLPSPRRLSPNNLSPVSRQRYDRIVKEAYAVPLPTHFYARQAGRRRARS